MVLEKTLESPLDSNEIKPVNPKGNQSWIVTGRTEAEVKVPTFWPPDVKSQLVEDPGWWERLRTRREGATENEIVGWHHRFNGHEFEQTPRNSEGQGSLAYCSPRGCKESDVIEQLSTTTVILMNHARCCKLSIEQIGANSCSH